MKNKNLPQGQYICSLDENEIKQAQRKRTVLLSLSSALLVLPSLFIKQAALQKLQSSNLTAISTALLLLYFIAACFSVYSLVMGFFRYKLVKRLLAKNYPKLDTSKHTWSVIEWSFYLSVLFCACQIALTAYCFSWGSLAVTALCALSSACAFLSKKISFECYRDKLTFVSLDEQLSSVSPPVEDADEFYNE